MECQEIKNLIPLFLDKELSENEMQLCQEHFRRCPGCQKELKIFERSWDMLEDAPGIEPRSDYMSRFWAKVSQQETGFEKFKRVIKGLLQPKLAPAFVTACLVIIVGLFALRNTFQIQEKNGSLTNLTTSEMELIENIELVENLDVIEDLEFLADLDFLEDEISSWDNFNQLKKLKGLGDRRWKTIT